jgi:hypothetical protein
VVPYREEMAKRHLKVTGDLGRVVFIVRVELLLAPLSLEHSLMRCIRNTTFETPSRSKRLSDTQMWFTT